MYSAHRPLKQTNKQTNNRAESERKMCKEIEEKMTASSCMDRVYGVYVVLGELVCLSNSVSLEKRKQSEKD